MPNPLTLLSSVSGRLRWLGAPAVLLARGVADLAYPPLCLGCERRLPDPSGALCVSCLRGLPPADLEAAARMMRGTDVDRALAVWAFDAGGTTRRVQHALKYGGRPSLGVQLGRLIGGAARDDRHSINVVVPVPLSKARRLERGYNQAEMLAQGAALALEVAMQPMLVRARATRTQASLSKSARRENVEGAFALDRPREMTGIRVLLIDDVITTGATLEAAARPLVEAGATVDVGALALAGA